MNWTDEPGTGNSIGADRRRANSGTDESQVIETTPRFDPLRGHKPHRPASGVGDGGLAAAPGLRAAVEEARRAVDSARLETREQAAGALTMAIGLRQQFWIDTCCDPAQMHAPSGQVLEHYMKWGCRFVAPTRDQAQVVLDALDAALPHWDRDHAELFYETLQLNFPEIYRHR